GDGQLEEALRRRRVNGVDRRELESLVHLGLVDRELQKALRMTLCALHSVLVPNTLKEYLNLRGKQAITGAARVHRGTARPWDRSRCRSRGACRAPERGSRGRGPAEGR